MDPATLSRKNHDITRWFEQLDTRGGTILTNKEKGWTSFDVVAKLRQILKQKKIGHTGTLDPTATGLLVICCGRATKSVSYFQNLDKIYRVEIKIGARTPSDDAETPEIEKYDYSAITKDDINRTVEKFIGTLSQVPPMYSAIHYKGRRLYQLARRGQVLETIPPRLVTIHSISQLEVDLPYIRFDVHCSKGTYIRALARDIGTVLGVGGYVTSLCRLSIGSFHIEEALTVQEIAHMVRNRVYENLPLLK